MKSKTKIDISERSNGTKGLRLAVVGNEIGDKTSAVKVIKLLCKQNVVDAIIVANYINPEVRSNLINALGIKSNWRVRIANDGEKLLAQTIYLSKNNHNIQINKNGIVLTKVDSTQKYFPIDYLFKSCAKFALPNSFAILFDSNSDDGKKGAKAISSSKQYVFGFRSSNSGKLLAELKDEGVISKIYLLKDLGADFFSRILDSKNNSSTNLDNAKSSNKRLIELTEQVKKLTLELENKEKEFQRLLSEEVNTKNAFNSIVENSVGAMLFGKPDGTILAVNKAACDLFGYTNEEFVKLTRSDIIDTTTLIAQSQVSERNEKGVFIGEMIAIKKGGKKFPCEVRSAIFIEEDGTKRTSTIIVDLTQKKNQEKELQDSHRNMQTILDNTDESFFVLDVNLTIVSFNNKAFFFSKRLLGKEFMVGESILKWASVERKPYLNKVYSHVLEGNTHFHKVELPNETNVLEIFGLSFAPIFAANRSVIGIMVNARDITKEELALTQLKRQKLLLNEAEYLAHVGSWEYDLETRALVWSDEYFRICGLEPQAFIPTLDLQLSKYIYSEDRLLFENLLNKLIKTGEKFDQVIRIVTKKGEIRFTECMAHLIAGIDGKLSKVVGIAKDITERIVIEEELVNSDNRYKVIFDNNPLPMFILEASTWQFVDVNDAAINHYGYTKAEFLKLKVADLRPKDTIAELTNILNKRPVNGRLYHGYAKHLKKNGELIDVLITANQVDFKGKKVTIVLANDVTEKLKVEKEIEDSNRNTNALINSTIDLIWSIDANKILTVANQTFIMSIFGLSGINIKVGNSVLDKNLFKDEQIEEWNKFYDRTLAGEKYSEISLFVINKHEHWRETFFSPILENGLVVGAAMYSRDITERKLLEDKQSLLVSVVNSSDDAIISKNLDGIVTSWNKGAEKLFGYTSEEIVGNNISMLIPNVLMPEEVMFIEWIKGGKHIKHYETIRKRKDQTEVIISITLSPILDAKANVIGVSKIARDITERKRQEEQLQKTLKEISDYKFALDQSSIVSISDKEGNITFVNENLIKISDYTKKELEGKNHRLFNSGYHPKSFFEEMWHTISSGKVWRGEIRNKAKGGKYYWTDTTIIPFLDDSKAPYQYIAIRTDITERKKAEEKMLESNERFEYVAKATFDAVWDWNLLTNAIIWGEGFKTIFGFELTSDVTDISEWMKNIHADDIERVQTKVNALMDGNVNNCGEEFQFLKGNKEYAYVSNKSVIVRDEDGKAVRIIGAMQDITQKKKEELRLKLLESVVLNAKDSVMITDGNKSPEIIYVNNSFIKMTGYSEEELIGKSPKMLQGPKTNKAELNKLRLAMDAKEACEIEVVNYKKNGQEFWINFSVVPIVNEKNELTHFIAIERDVTLQKKMNEEKKRILESISDCFFVLDKEFKITYMNSASEKVLKFDRDGLNKVILWDKYPALAKGLFYEKLQEVITTNQPVHFEYYFEQDNTWYDESFFPSEEGVSVFFRPIDDRKRAEELLKSTLEDKNAILESFGDGFFAIDANWVVTYWNNKAEEITMVKRKYIIHRDFRCKFKKNLSEKFYEKLEKALKNKEAIHFVEYSDHYKQWFEISVYPSGNGLSVYFKNVSKRIAAEEELTKLNVELKRRADELLNSNAELERFAYVASHDLQEPLRMVSSFLQLLKKKYENQMDETGNKYIHFAVDGAERMKVLINDLLQYSRVGTASIEITPINMNQVVNDVLGIFKETKILSHIEKLPIITASKTAMMQLFQNLIGNSIKYNENSTVEISISAIELPDYWRFTVQDNGIGIEEKYFEKVFVVFQRLHNKDEYTGTGIGLAICKKIVERYKGKIWIESEIGKGSKFIFTIAKRVE